MGNPAPLAHQKMRHWQWPGLGFGPVPAPELGVTLPTIVKNLARRFARLFPRQEVNILHHATAFRARRRGASARNASSAA